MYSLEYKPWQAAYAEGSMLLLDKPLGWTSFDVVKKIRILTGISKVGHAGTLDPLATGLLIVCTGKYTKQIQQYMAQEKEYHGRITLGAVTDTYDLESEPQASGAYEHLDRETLERAAASFTGDIVQVPPAHSAVKKGGVPAYLLARKGKEVKLEPRQVRISRFTITDIQLPNLEFQVVCSTGTYIRSLANDFGSLLGCGAYLSALKRTRIGSFLLEDAQTPQEFETVLKSRKAGQE